MIWLRFILVLVACVSVDRFVDAADSTPDFSREVRPILAKHCFTCHGPDPEARESDLRLDYSEPATADLGGYAAIVPGDAGKSELIARISSEDAEIRMPPAESHPPLTADQIETLRRWIDGGAAYEAHWAFVPPSRPQVVDVKADDWCKNVIDRYVLRRMEQASLTPSPRASRESLIRRLYLDLTGITPTPSAVESFLSDDHPAAYQRLVDRLLATPGYAERFARPWLDLARYADTNGYEKDRPRTIWPYRDWVIRAIAADMPLDQFSIEQLAGDMLPNATNDHLIATGFHRNTMLNEEGGIDPLEFRFYAVVDRVATTGTVWMGLTIGCAQCHTHKYDPITHTDYYSLFALLNNADEPDVMVDDANSEKRRGEIEAKIARLEQQLIDESLPSRQEHEADKIGEDPIKVEWIKWYDEQIAQSRNWQRLKLVAYESTMPKLAATEDASILASGDVTKRDVYHLDFKVSDNSKPITAIRLEALPHPLLPAGGPGMGFYEGRRGDFFLSEMKVSVDGQPVALTELSHSYGKISVGSGSTDAKNVIDGNGSTGWSASGNEGKASQLVANFATPVIGQSVNVELLFERHFAAALGRFRVSVTSDDGKSAATTLPESFYDWYVNDREDVDDENYAELQRHFVRTTPQLAEQRKPIDKLRVSLPKPVRTLGMRERRPGDRRQTRRHHRGQYLQGKEEVAGEVPSLFEPLDGSSPKDRLTLARWLVSKKNPLFARVAVNRGWREFFGTGIVDTAGDFGTQSEPPSHPLLLDWLASELVSNGWFRKKLHRRIVMSAAYQQAVTKPPATDPRHRLVSGFPHRRLEAERVRDALLSASGLLSRRVGGPSVYPPQSKSVTAMAWGNSAWNASKGANRYRRSLYTFSKRTAPFAAFTTFDGPSGETCMARRDRSTTPLQALTLMNDQMYMEIAAGLADTTLRNLPAGTSPTEIASAMFRRLLVRPPDPEELDAILTFYWSQKSRKDPWKLVARALMNTDEAITTP
jgi:hypothetical protein